VNEERLSSEAVPEANVEDVEDSAAVDAAESEAAKSEAAEPEPEVVPEVEVEVEDELVTVARDRDAYLDALQRLKAEFDNYRKRAAREQEALMARASERLVTALLPVLDDLGRALEAAESHEEAKLEEGVRLVQRALADALAREGLAEIEAEGAFDPNVHEALLAQPSDAPSGTVIDVVQKGYRLGDRVLRPARVIVAE
jgi:molecular chaperone GrpE